MTKRQTVRAALVLALVLSAGNGFCGGAWVPAPGDGDVQLGFSRKTASSSWNSSGVAFENTTRVDGELKQHYHVLAMPVQAWSDPAFMGVLLDNRLPYARLSLLRNPGALISLARLKTADDYSYMH